MNKLLPCPFCGEPPSFNNEGSELEISCCASMRIQKWHYLSLEQRATWDNSGCYSNEAEKICKKEIVALWNTRHDKPTLVV